MNKYIVFSILLIFISCMKKERNDFNKINSPHKEIQKYLSINDCKKLAQESIKPFSFYNPSPTNDTLNLPPKERLKLAYRISDMIYSDQYHRRLINLCVQNNIENKKIDSLKNIQNNVDLKNISELIKITKEFGFPSGKRFYFKGIDTLKFKINPGAGWLIYHHSNPLGFNSIESKELISKNFLKGRINLSTFSILQ